MTYSVYNRKSLMYDYYEGAAGGTPRGGKYTAADEAGWPLPAGASWVGSGPDPRGRIATAPGARSALGGLPGGIPAIGLAVAAYAAYRALRR